MDTEKCVAALAHSAPERDLARGLDLPTLDVADPHLLLDVRLPGDALTLPLVGIDLLLHAVVIRALIDRGHVLILLHLLLGGYQREGLRIGTNLLGGENADENDQCLIPHLAELRGQEVAAAPSQVMDRL